MASDSLVYKTSVFIGQLHRSFVVHVRVIAVAKVADAERVFGDERQYLDRSKGTKEWRGGLTA